MPNLPMKILFPACQYVIGQMNLPTGSSVTHDVTNIILAHEKGIVRISRGVILEAYNTDEPLSSTIRPYVDMFKRIVNA